MISNGAILMGDLIGGLTQTKANIKTKSLPGCVPVFCMTIDIVSLPSPDHTAQHITLLNTQFG